MMQFQSLKEQIDDLRTWADNPQQRVRTGFESIDTLSGGPAPGEVCMILGRSFTGKSLVGQNIIVSNQNLGSIFFSLEMPYIQALGRMYCMWSGTPNTDFNDMMSKNAVPIHLNDMAEAFPLHRIVDEPGLSLAGMSEYLNKYYEIYAERPAFVVIDYLELLGGAKKSGEGWLGTEVQATSLKDWARSEEMRVFVIHQTNMQEPPHKPPTMNSARGAGYTEADFVFGMWQPARNPELAYTDFMSAKDEVHFNILKNRTHGDSWGGRDLKFALNGDLTFTDLTGR